MTRVKITAAGFDFIAETHPDAPLTVAAFTALLPYRQKLIHVRWSGASKSLVVAAWSSARG